MKINGDSIYIIFMSQTTNQTSTDLIKQMLFLSLELWAPISLTLKKIFIERHARVWTFCSHSCRMLYAKMERKKKNQQQQQLNKANKEFHHNSFFPQLHDACRTSMFPAKFPTNVLNKQHWKYALRQNNNQQSRRTNEKYGKIICWAIWSSTGQSSQNTRINHTYGERVIFNVSRATGRYERRKKNQPNEMYSNWGTQHFIAHLCRSCYFFFSVAIVRKRKPTIMEAL